MSLRKPKSPTDIAVIAMDTIMNDTGVYLEKISAFSRMLRLEGLSVGPRETADAASILISLGMADREQVKTALRTVFAKSREEQLRFDNVFDGFFLSEEAIRAWIEEQRKREEEQEQQRRAAQEELEQYGDSVSLTDRQREEYSAMSEESRERLRKFMERYKNNADRNPGLYTEFIHSVFARAIMEQQMMMEDAGLGCEAADPELGILYRDIGEFRDNEIPKAISMIQTIARQINGELTAKRNASGHSGRLDFRRTIRRSLAYGGTPAELRWRRKHRRRKELIMLCDVSGSMVQFSEFALRFIQSLQAVSDHSRVFLFSERMVEADAFRLQNMDSFRSYIRDTGIYGRGTDLGSALEQMASLRPPILTGSTTLLILSDTKTIDMPRAMQALVNVKRLCGRVIWLNPIPENKWKYIGSIQRMASVCTMIPCSTLRELAAACRRLTKT